MKIRVERLEIEVPGFMENLGEIVLGEARASREVDLVADGGGTKSSQNRSVKCGG